MFTDISKNLVSIYDIIFVFSDNLTFLTSVRVSYSYLPNYYVSMRS